MITKKLAGELLHAYGWLTEHVDLDEAIRQFQRFYGLLDDGIVGPQTTRFLTAPRYCLRDSIASNVAKWNKQHLKWIAFGELNALSNDDILNACKYGFEQFSKVCGLTFEWTQTPDDADVHMFFGQQMDGPGNVLADSNLPPTNPIRQRYDRAERWSVQWEQHYIYLQNVITHELGHGVGLGHEPLSNGTAMMNPIYSPDVKTLQPLDVAKLQSMYGKPKGNVPKEQPTQGNNVQIDLTKARLSDGILTVEWKIP